MHLVLAKISAFVQFNCTVNFCSHYCNKFSVVAKITLLANICNTNNTRFKVHVMMYTSDMHIPHNIPPSHTLHPPPSTPHIPLAGLPACFGLGGSEGTDDDGLGGRGGTGRSPPGDSNFFAIALVPVRGRGIGLPGEGSSSGVSRDSEGRFMVCLFLIGRGGAAAPSGSGLGSGGWNRKRESDQTTLLL